MARFFADECVASPVIDGLRTHGLDVIDAKDASPGATDERVLALAAGSGRVVITDDRGFGELAVRHEQRAAGVIVLALYDLPEAARENYAVDRIVVLAAKVEGQLTIIEPGRVRFRPLP